MNKLEYKKMNKILKSTLAFVIAGTFTISSTTAFATDEQKEDIGLEVITEVEGNTNHEGIEEAITQLEKIELETPSVVPGDFLYFAKLALEKIKLAFTLDQEKEAMILAENALERLAEAEVLFEKGNEEEAIEIINNAIKYIADAEQLDEDGEDSDESGTKKTETNTENQEATKEDVKAENTAFSETDYLMTQNMIALTANMEKIKNPVAKAALKKNIIKSHEKLAKKLEKIEAKYTDVQVEEEEEKKATIVDETTSTAEANTKVDTTENSIVTDASKEEKVRIQEEKAQQKAELKQEKQAMKEEKQAAKEIRKEEKAAEKQSKKEEKAVAKQEKKQAKNEEKQAKAEEKQKHKQEGNGNSKK